MCSATSPFPVEQTPGAVAFGRRIGWMRPREVIPGGWQGLGVSFRRPVPGPGLPLSWFVITGRQEEPALSLFEAS